MTNYMSSLSFSLKIILIIYCLQPMSSVSEKYPKNNPKTRSLVAAILDLSSREGREEKIAINIAIEDFCLTLPNLECPFNLLVNDDSPGSTTLDETVYSANTIIKEHHAKAIMLGLESSTKALIVAEIGNESQVPILFLANDQVPNWTYNHFPFLINAARSQHAQMKAVAAIIHTWQWQKVNVIYEDLDSVTAGLWPYLIQAIQEAGSQISTILPVPPYLSSKHNVTKKLERLKDEQCMVYIVHTSSLKLATKIFESAKILGLMEEDSVWITTTSITSHIDSLSPSAVSSLQGVLGLKTYFPKSGDRFKSFRAKFRDKYRTEFPRDSDKDPGIFAVQAYDAAWSLALAFEAGKKPSNCNFSSKNEELLDNLLATNFDGLTGKMNFNHGVLPHAHIFEIINIEGRSYSELGYWTEGLGFSKRISKHSHAHYNQSMKNLGQVIWPGRPWTVPRGWSVSKNSKPLRIAVPVRTTFSEFVNFEKRDASGNLVPEGFSIRVFKEAVDLLPYPLLYEFVPVNATSYDSMVQQVGLQIFDALVADTAIVAKRCKYVEFSQPYAESGLQMMVYYEPVKLEKAWIFVKPFTLPLWVSTFFLNIFNGLVLYFAEREVNKEFSGSLWNQAGVLFASSFKTLFSFRGPKLSKNSTRISFIVWLFVCVILIQSYTASLTALLTDDHRSPITIDIETLKTTGSKVGCDANSFVVKYLEEALGFDPKNIVKIHSGDEYPKAFENHEIEAAFLEVPYVNLFLKKHCKNFVLSGQPLNVGGFGFAFAKSSPYLPDISEAILNISESGRLLELEKTMYSSRNCSVAKSKSGILDFASFSGLFAISGAISANALMCHLVTKWFEKFRGRDQGAELCDPHGANHNVDDEQDQQRPNQNHQGDDQKVVHISINNSNPTL